MKSTIYSSRYNTLMCNPFRGAEGKKKGLLKNKRSKELAFGNSLQCSFQTGAEFVFSSPWMENPSSQKRCLLHAVYLAPIIGHKGILSRGG
jgi:hypothetical protein